MTTLAGHGKDKRLVQTDFVPLGQAIALPFDYEISDKEKKNENYTPNLFIEPIREFLGGIDLDAFSNAIAQQTVQALTFWTKADNALTKNWTKFNKKFCNPPFGGDDSKIAAKCVDKILEYIHIGETVLVMNSSTSTKWFHKCLNTCAIYVHPTKRISFYNPYREIEYAAGKKRTGNDYDQTIFYWGDRPLEFAKALAHLGNAVQPIKNQSCFLHSSTISEVLEPLVIPPTSQEKSNQSHTSTSAKMHKKSTVRTSQKQVSTATSATITHREESISLQVDSLAPTLAMLATGQDLTANILNFGLNICDVSMKDSPDLSSSKTPAQLSIADYEQFLEDSEWLDIVGTIRKSCKVLCSEVPKKGNDCLSLPTLTSNLGTIRPAGQNRSEKWFRDNGFLQSTQVLSAEMMALLFGFPSDWTACLQDAIAGPVDESNLDISLGEQLTSIVQPLSSSESYFLTDNLDVSPRTALDELQLKANALIQSGASPKGVWIERSKPQGKDFLQACWRSDKPHEWLGDRKTRYIGKWEGDAHVSAKSQFVAGKKLKEIHKQIKELSK
jgi:hypothetical protein